MSGELLQTKLYVPRLRPSLVPRPCLIEKLNLIGPILFHAGYDLMIIVLVINSI